MYYYGSFLTHQGDTVTVHIVTHGDRSTTMEIGREGGNVFFTTDPVEITSSVNDTFDHLLCSQASIRLLTRDFISDFFCASCMDAVVNIYRGGECVFAGFIEPQAYSQPYNEVYDELELNCIDVLSALQYSKYRGVGSIGVVYDVAKADAGQRTFADIIGGMLDTLCSGIDILGSRGIKTLYDRSKALSSDHTPEDIFGQLSVSELLFLGDSEDDVWNYDKVLEEIMRYLNLHIVQQGMDFYIFSWESVKDATLKPITWAMSEGGRKTVTRQMVPISLANAASDDTTISIGEVFNQISLTCNVDSVDNVIESPLDKNALTSPFDNCQLYLREYSAVIKEDEGKDQGKAFKAFYAMTHDQDPPKHCPTNYTIDGKDYPAAEYEGGTVTDWKIQIRTHPSWIFPDYPHGDLMRQFCRDNAHQEALLNYIGGEAGSTGRAAIIEVGKIERKYIPVIDNSPDAAPSMTPCLFVTVNGNNIGKEAEGAWPNEQSIKDGIPLAVYEGPTSGAVYSPADDKTTNYIVISGSIALNPLYPMSGLYRDLHNTTGWNYIDKGAYIDNGVFNAVVPCKESEEYGRYYTQQYFSADTPGPVKWDEGINRGLTPFTDKGLRFYQYTNLRGDRLSKVPVLACMLIVGDKCLVETGAGGAVSDFEWHAYKAKEQCVSLDEYYSQCFTIGFNPKIDDYIVGTEYDIQNNISHEMGIDAQGIAIPIRKSDQLSGKVQFSILGPVNLLWIDDRNFHNVISPSPAYPFYKNMAWSESVSVVSHILPHLSSIVVKGFEMKVYSDNGLINNVDDNSDLVYMSDTKETFVNRKDDITFEICSALTSEERQDLGVRESVNLNTPLDTVSNTPLLSIYDCNKQVQAKAEQLYVDSYYTEYHKPRIVMVQKINDRSDVSLFNHYRHPAMPDKSFYVYGIGYNLMEGYVELNLKEAW